MFDKIKRLVYAWLMKNGKISPEVFSVLDDIRAAYGIKAQAWANAGGFRNADISNMRKLLKGDKTRRVFSYKKLNKMVKGLENLIGVKIMKKEVLRRLKQAKSQEEKLHLLIAVLSKESSKSAAEQYLKTLVDLESKS